MFEPPASPLPGNRVQKEANGPLFLQSGRWQSSSRVKEPWTVSSDCLCQTPSKSGSARGGRFHDRSPPLKGHLELPYVVGYTWMEWQRVPPHPRGIWSDSFSPYVWTKPRDGISKPFEPHHSLHETLVLLVRPEAGPIPPVQLSLSIRICLLRPLQHVPVHRNLGRDVSVGFPQSPQTRGPIEVPVGCTCEFMGRNKRPAVSVRPTHQSMVAQSIRSTCAVHQLDETRT